METAEGTCILAEDRELPREPAEDAILTFKFNFGEKRLVKFLFIHNHIDSVYNLLISFQSQDFRGMLRQHPVAQHLPRKGQVRELHAADGGRQRAAPAQRLGPLPESEGQGEGQRAQGECCNAKLNFWLFD